MTAYYNEHDRHAAAWLRELIRAGQIAPGEVDERSIEDITPNEVSGFDQVHWFAGIAGWSYALRLAGWPDDRPVWTGSCPCQPFSAAGKKAGFADERHLWPAWFHLIRICRPQRIFGEQVAAALSWLDLVQRDLEGAGYACGAAIVGAHSVSAPHIRQRLYWTAEPQSGQSHGCWDAGGRRRELADGGDARWLGHTVSAGSQGRSERRDGRDRGAPRASGLAGRMEYPAGDGRLERGSESSGRLAIGGCWEGVEWIPCADGKARPTQPGIFPLAHGVPGRVGLLRGFGNAIVPQVAAAFIAASIA